MLLPTRAQKHLYYPKRVCLTSKTNNLFNKHVLSDHYMLGTFLSARYTAVNKPHGFYVLNGKEKTK